MFNNDLMARVSAAVPDGVTHLGAVLIDIKGRVAVYHPPVPKHGVTATIPRVRRAPDESPAQTLRRACFDVAGCGPLSVFPIRQVWATPNSVSYFFAAAVDGNAPKGRPWLTWRPPEEAQRVIGASVAGPGRARDLYAIASATTMCLSPHRRVLEMVRELHRMGYEQLRACCFIYAIGTWRCSVVPASWTSRENGGRLAFPGFGSTDKASERPTVYSSAHGQSILFTDFYVPGIEFATPRDLAEAFVTQRPGMAYAGRGPDPDYARWLDASLQELGPFGVYFSDDDLQAARLHTAQSELPSLPLPPPGPYPQAWWDNYMPG